MPDPIRKRFCYGQLWPFTAQRAARIRPDSICRIRLPASISAGFFCCCCFFVVVVVVVVGFFFVGFFFFFFFFFERRQGSYCAKTDQDPIWMVWSGFGQTHLSGSKLVCRNHLGPVSDRTQPTR